MVAVLLAHLLASLLLVGGFGLQLLAFLRSWLALGLLLGFAVAADPLAAELRLINVVDAGVLLVVDPELVLVVIGTHEEPSGGRALVNELPLSDDLIGLLDLLDFVVAAHSLGGPRRGEAQALGAVGRAAVERIGNARRVLRVSRQVQVARILVAWLDTALRRVAILIVSLSHVGQREPLLLGLDNLKVADIGVGIVLVGAAEPVRVRGLLALLQVLLLDLKLPHTLVEGLIERLVVLLDLLLQFINPLISHIWDQLPRLPSSRAVPSSLLAQVDPLEAAFPALRLELPLKMLQLGLKLVVVDLLLVADLRVRTLLLEILLGVFNLVEDLDVRGDLLLPVLDLHLVSVGHGQAVAIIVDGLVLGIIILLPVVSVPSLMRLVSLFTIWVSVSGVVSIDLILVVDVSVVDHVLVLVHERAAVPQDLHVLLLPLH